MGTRLNTYMRVPRTAELHGTEYCIWEGVEPRYAAGAKGLGLFATRKLPKGYCIPLGGIWRSYPEVVSIGKHPDRHYPMASAYFVAYRRPQLTEKGKRKRTEGGVLDTHPLLAFQLGLPFFCWPGGLVNSRNAGEPKNCALECKTEVKGRFPTYPHHVANPVFVETIRIVEAGEELLMDYNYSAQTQKRRGFGPQSEPCTPKAMREKQQPSKKVYDVGERQSPRLKRG